MLRVKECVCERLLCEKGCRLLCEIECVSEHLLCEKECVCKSACRA